MNTIRGYEWQTQLWFLLFLGLLGMYGLTVQAAPEPAGWYAGDMHVHRSCGGSPVTVSSLVTKMSTNNLAVISLLADMGNGEVQNPVTDLPRVNGQDDPISTSSRKVHWDAEWHWDATYGQYAHQALGGHVVALGLTEAHQMWEEYTYPIFEWAHKQNGIAGFVHMQYLDNNIPQSLTCCTPIEYPVEVALGEADFIAEDVTGGDSAMQAYYRLLNTGFRPGLAAGTDYPCGVSVLGSLLTYVQVAGGQMTYRNWIDGIAKGRTVVSRNGHNEFLELKVTDPNDPNHILTPGDEIKLMGGGSVPVQITITWMAKNKLSGTIELVQNGVVARSKNATVAAGGSTNWTTTVEFTKSGWLAARRMGSGGHKLHTAAIFVTVDGAPIRASVDDARFYVQWIDNLLEKTSPGGEWSSYFLNSRDAAQQRYRDAKEKYQLACKEAGSDCGTPGQSLAITTISLPGGMVNVAYSTTLQASGGTTPYTWSIINENGSLLPDGLTLNTGSGTIAGTPITTGTYRFTAQVSDKNNQTVTKPLSITIADTLTKATIWPDTVTPTVKADPDTSTVELGVKFRSSVAGYITGLRFYKDSTNTGPHVGNLWSSSGALLATVPFSNETTSGWQQANFASPVAISPDTVYVASYHAPNGRYSVNEDYFTNSVTNGPLYALRNGESGGNGIYVYDTNSVFPTETYKASNYWVDVVFQPGQ